MKAESTLTTFIILLGVFGCSSSDDKHHDSDANARNSPEQQQQRLESKRTYSDFSNLNLKDVTSSESSQDTKPHSRKKRLIWVTDDGRLALPPGTSLTITPTLAMPLVRYPPDGFFSNISVSLPLTRKFDSFNLLELNPLWSALTVEFWKKIAHP